MIRFACQNCLFKHLNYFGIFFPKALISEIYIFANIFSVFYFYLLTTLCLWNILGHSRVNNGVIHTVGNEVLDDICKSSLQYQNTKHRNLASGIGKTFHTLFRVVKNQETENEQAILILGAISKMFFIHMEKNVASNCCFFILSMFLVMSVCIFLCVYSWYAHMYMLYLYMCIFCMYTNTELCETCGRTTIFVSGY